MSQAVINVEGLTKRFDDTTAVDAVSFAVPAGTVVGLLGGNGAGKTTTISMLLGLLLPTSGTIEILGVDMLRHRHRVLTRMNFSSPYVDLPHRLTVAEIAEALDIAQFLKRPTGKLSAGQKTRVALAKALLNKPDVLLLDEPTASLDPDTADWVRTYLETYRRETNATILLASHNMLEVERLCSLVLMMRKGSIVDRGTPTELLERYGRDTMEDVFLDIARERRTGGVADAAAD